MAAKSFESIGEFMLDTPLYSPRIAVGHAHKAELRGLIEGAKFDGHCPSCGKETTYLIKTSPHARHLLDSLDTFGSVGHQLVECTCARVTEHKLIVNYFIRKWEIYKVGQWPSLADIANDESKEYRSVLSKGDAAELHMAIGLAAHGVGIGSFVYLRRIFERLIWQRFNEFKGAEGWTEQNFQKLRMDDKIGFLKGHLPEFLVQNKSVYSILSAGIHELTEEECLGDFEILRAAIVMMLDEDRRRKEELDQQQKLKAAIQRRSSEIGNKKAKSQTDE